MPGGGAAAPAWLTAASCEEGTAKDQDEGLESADAELLQRVEELSAANDDLRNLMAATQVPTLFLDRRLRIHRVTPTLDRLFEVRPADEGHPISRVTHRLDYDALEEDCRKVLETLRPLEREVDGGEGQHLLARIVPYRTREDRVAGVVATFTDITRVRNAEERLRRSEERHRLLVEGVKEYAIFMLDPDGEITMWNSGAQEVFGYSESEAVGQPVALIFTEEDRAAGLVEAELRMARTAGQAMDERWHVRRDGSRFWASGVMTAVYGDDDQLRGFAKLLRDNTERREREEALRRSREALRRLNETLEERVAERTAELEEANRRVRSLASEVVIAEQRVRRRVARRLHDELQQQIYALQMRVPILRRTLGSEGAASVEPVLGELESRLADAVQVARRLTVDLSPRTLEGEGLLEALGWLVEQMRERHGLRVEVLVDEAFDAENEDLRVMLFQSVRELLFNVVKHADADRATVELGREGGRRVIRVIDEGAGFDLESVRSRSGVEEGFGLFHVAERLDLIGGGLDVRSEPGDGTRITIVLPEEKAAPDER